MKEKEIFERASIFIYLYDNMGKILRKEQALQLLTISKHKIKISGGGRNNPHLCFLTKLTEEK